MSYQHMQLQLNNGITNTLPAVVSEVKYLQQQLKNKSVYPANEPIDGQFGSNTEQSVKTFQTKLFLEVDGVVGQQTWAALLDVSPEAIEIVSVPGSSGIGQMEDLNPAIEAAAKSLWGMDTSCGPDNGRNACAWTVNQILQKVGIATLGSNPNYVPSLVDALDEGRGQKIARGEEAGDLVIAFQMEHIGVCMGKGLVWSNSSSHACFRWESDLDFDNEFSGQPSYGIYRLVS
jgi:hypothetical protein